MRKFTALLLALTMALSLAACGGGASSSSETTAGGGTSASAETTAGGGTSASAETTAGAGGTASAETTAPASTTAEEPASSAEQSETPASADASKYEVTAPIEFEFWFSPGNLVDYFNQIVEEYNASQDLITVTVRRISGGYGGVRESLAAAQAAGTGIPGLVTMNFPSVPSFGMSGAAEDLTPYFEAFNVDKEDYVAGYMDAVDVDGAIYAMPQGPSCQIYFYNKDVIEGELGLTFPTTWEEFKTFVQTVYEKTGKPAVTYDTDQNTYYNMAINFGGTFQKEDGTTGLDNEQLITRMKEMRELVKAGYVLWDVESSAESVLNTYYNGDTFATARASSDFLNVMNENFVTGTAWNFEDAHAYSTIAGMALLIPSTVSQEIKNAAFQFVLWLSTPEQNERFAMASGFSMSHYSSIQKGTGEGTPIAEQAKTLPGIEVLYEHSDDIVSKAKSPYYDAVMKSFQSCIDRIMSDMSVDFDSTWAAMVEECNYILAGN